MFNLRPLLFAPDDGSPAPGQPDDKGALDVAKLQAQIQELQAQVKRIPELENESRTWHERYQQLDHATKTSGAKGGDLTEDDDDKAIEEKLADGVLIDELSKGDIGSLVKKGVLTKADGEKLTRRIVREEIEAAGHRMSHQQKLLQAFPDIDNPKSTLYKAVEAQIKSDGPEAYSHPQAFRILVELKAKELETASAPPPGRSNRIAAIAAQQGRVGGGGGQRGMEDDDDEDVELNDAQRKMLADLNGDGRYVVTEEAFKKRAKKGVNIHGATATAMMHMQQAMKGSR
jgi:hypothetical protein